MFARRVIDVRGEGIGQHLFPIDCGSLIAVLGLDFVSQP